MYVENSIQLFATVPGEENGSNNKDEQEQAIDIQYVYRQVAISMLIIGAFILTACSMYWCIKKSWSRRNGATGVTVRYDNSLQQNMSDLDVSVYREEVSNPMQHGVADDDDDDDDASAHEQHRVIITSQDNDDG